MNDEYLEKLSKEELFQELNRLTGIINKRIIENGSRPEEYPNLLGMTACLSQYEESKNQFGVMCEFSTECVKLTEALEKNYEDPKVQEQADLALGGGVLLKEKLRREQGRR